jgi:hypothetical protein
MSRIRRLTSASLAFPLVILVSACGGSSKPTTATSSSPGGEIVGPQSLVAHLPPINQFPQLRPISQPNVITSPLVWVASGGLPGTPGQAEATRLRRLGFVAAVQEELGSNQPVTAEVNAQVEQFRGPATANTELSYHLRQARETGRSPGYKFARFSVAGVPGAVGYSVKQAASTSDAVAFASGSYFYLLQSVVPAGSGKIVTAQQLSREATAWYRHLQAL